MLLLLVLLLVWRRLQPLPLRWRRGAEHVDADQDTDDDDDDDDDYDNDCYYRGLDDDDGDDKQEHHSYDTRLL